MKIAKIDFVSILRNREYDSLRINRIHGICYLIIEHEGEKHTLTDNKGKKKEYRHAWQIKEWLEKEMGISEAPEIPVV